jgi:hypothetical protein
VGTNVYGCDFGKVPVPDPHLEADPDHIWQFKQKFLQNLSFNVRSSIVSQEVFSSFSIFYFCFLFFDFCIPFHVGSRSKSGTGMHSG